MEGYLGEKIVPQENTKFKDYQPFDWSMYFLERYGQIDGADHKMWVLDQIAQIYNGAEVIIKVAQWSNGHQEYRIGLGEKTQKYEKWKAKMQAGEDGSYTYEYDEGIPP